MDDETNNPWYTEQMDKLKKDRDSWHNAWFEARLIGGKMYWDGATYGYTKGLEDKGTPSPYGIAERASEIARDISILLDVYKTAHLDVGLEIKEDDQLMVNILPLTYVITRYKGTGDEILFQYIDGKRTVARIKTHDGLFVDTDGIITKNPQAELFHKEPR